MQIHFLSEQQSTCIGPRLNIPLSAMIPTITTVTCCLCTSVDYMRSDKRLVIYICPPPHATCHMQPRTRLIIIRREVRTMSLFRRPFPISPIFTAGTCAAKRQDLDTFLRTRSVVMRLVLGMGYNICALDRRAHLVISRLIEKFRDLGYRYVSYLYTPCWHDNEPGYGLSCTQRLVFW